MHASISTRHNWLWVWLLLFILLASVLHGCGADFSDFTHALNMVETSGRTGPIMGDSGRARGPLQIHYSYWIDAGGVGKYSDCDDYNKACETVRRYLKRYCIVALEHRDWETCARVHNGGPTGAHKNATKNYWLRVKKHLTS